MAPKKVKVTLYLDEVWEDNLTDLIQVGKNFSQGEFFLSVEKIPTIAEKVEASKEHRLDGISDVTVNCICGWEFQDDSIKRWDSWEVLTAAYEAHRVGIYRADCWTEEDLHKNDVAVSEVLHDPTPLPLYSESGKLVGNVSGFVHSIDGTLPVPHFTKDETHG